MAPSVRPGNPADEWDRLVQGGVSPEDATNRVAAAYGPPPQAAPSQPTRRLGVPGFAAESTGVRPDYQASQVAAAAEPAQFGTGFLRSAGQGATFGFSDEAVAGVRSLAGEPYDAAVADERAKLDAYRAAHPGTAFGAELLGGLAAGGAVGAGAKALGVGARAATSGSTAVADYRRAKAAGTAGGRLLRGARTLGAGVASGGLAGAGMADEGHRLQGAEAGAAFGAGTSAALSGVGALLSPFGALVSKPQAGTVRGAVTRRLGGLTAEDAAKADVLKQIGRSRVALPELEAAARTALPDEMLLDVGGDALVARAGGAVATPSTGAQDIRTALQARAERTPKRLRGRVAEGLGVQRENQKLLTDDLMAQRRAAAQPLYEQAYAAPAIEDPDVLALFDDEAFQDAYATARRLAKREGVDLPERVGRVAPATPATAVPESGTWREFLKANMGPAMKQYGSHGEAIKQLGAQWKARGVQSATVATDAAPDVAADVAESLVPVPVQAFDYVKRGLDDVIERRMKSGAIGRTEARQLRLMLRDGLEKVDEAVPDYAAARAQYAGDSALLDAQEAGRDFLKESADELSAKWPTLSEGEQAMYRKGAMAAIEDRLKGRTDGLDATRLFRDDLMRDKLRLLFPDEQAFQAFEQDVGRFHGMHTRTQSILGNSKTAERLAQMNESAGPSLEGGAALLTGNPLPLAGFGVRAWLKQHAQGLTEQQVNALAPLLTSMGPDELQRVVADLSQFAARDASRVPVTRRLGRSVAQAAGGAAGRQ